MRFLSVMVVVGCVPVDGAVQSGHAGALNNFFGLTLLSGETGGVYAAKGMS
jgi:hypothetical protein